MNSRKDSVIFCRRSVVRESAYTLGLVLGIHIGMEREQADMIKIVEKVMGNWKEIALVVESIVSLMVAFGWKM